VNVNATGGHAPYLYSFNTGPYTSTNFFSGLAGNVSYVVYVKDATNCVLGDSYFVSQPNPITVQPIINNITCAGGNNGAISLNVSGGVAPYNYYWSNGGAFQSIFNLNAGVYSVSIQDFNGCVSAQSYTLNQPANPLVVNGAVIPSTSGNSNDGSIDVTVNGGVAPYTFNWSNGATTEDVSNLNPGTYLLTIVDANGCTTSSAFIISGLTGIANLQITANEVVVYPNPATEYASIEAKGFEIEKVDVIDLLGKVLLENEVHGLSARINTNNLPNGTYFVTVHFTNNNNTVTKKIVVNK